MSVTSEELNYLIWRYLQEAGHEVTAFALQDETKVHELDERYNKSIQIGCLVDLVQKGILYCETESLLNDNGTLKTKEQLKDAFTLFDALNKKPRVESVGSGNSTLHPVSNGSAQTSEQPTGSSALINSVSTVPEAQHNKADKIFIKVLEKSFAFEPSVASCWNPVTASVVSWGQHNSCAKIAVLGESIETSDLVTLSHPPSNSQGREDISCVSWAPKGHFLITGSENGELRLWTAEGKLRNLMALHHAPIVAICWSEDSSYVLSQDNGGNAIVWDINLGSPMQHISYLPNTVTLQSSTWIDSEKFAIPGPANSIQIYQISGNTPIGQLQGHTGPIGCLSYCSEYQILASGSDDSSIRIWKGNSYSSAQTLLGHDQSIVSLHWAKNTLDSTKPLLLSTSLDGSVRGWDINNGELLLAHFFDGVPIFEAQLSRDGTLLAVGTEEGTVSIIDLSEKYLTKELSRDSVGQFAVVAQFEKSEQTTLEDYITSVSWNSDGTKLCVAYNKSETVIVDYKKSS